jgi:hypothetical protein
VPASKAKQTMAPKDLSLIRAVNFRADDIMVKSFFKSDHPSKQLAAREAAN